MTAPREIEGWSVSETGARKPDTAGLVYVTRDERSLWVEESGGFVALPMAVLVALLRARGWTVVEPGGAPALHPKAPNLRAALADSYVVTDLKPHPWLREALERPAQPFVAGEAAEEAVLVLPLAPELAAKVTRAAEVLEVSPATFAEGALALRVVAVAEGRETKMGGGR
jgi:hypothetical protein